jgi:hypothetical protein
MESVKEVEKVLPFSFHGLPKLEDLSSPGDLRRIRMSVDLIS